MSSTSIIDELVTLLGIDLKSDTMQKVHRFTDGLDSVAKYALGATAAISAAAASVGYFTEKAVESASRLDKFAELTGQSAQSLQKWSFAAEQAGGSAASVKGDIMGLVKSMNPVMPGEFNEGLFMLGMYEKKYKDIDDLLMALGDKFKSMPAGKALNWAAHIGISEDTVLLLKRGREGIQQLRQQTPFLMSDDQLKQARQFEAQVNRIKYAFKTVGDMVAVGITPEIEKVLGLVEAWAGANHEIISTKIDAFLEGMAEGFGKIWDRIMKVKDWLMQTAPVIGTVIDALSDANTVGNITAGVLTGIAIALGIASIEWVAAAAAIALAALAVDDFCTYLDGGKSLIGDTIGYVKTLYNEFATKFPNIAKFIIIVVDWLKILGKLSLDAIIFAIKGLWGALVKIADVFGTTLKGLAWLLNLLLEPFVSLFGDDKNNPVGSPESGPKPVSDTNRKILSEGLNKAILQFQGAPLNPTAPVAPAGNGGGTTTVNDNRTTHVTVQTQSSDAYGIARELSILLPNNFKVQGQAAGAQ